SHELFSDGVGHPEVLRLRAGYATDDLTLADAAEDAVNCLARESPPVRAHRKVQGGMPEDAGRPFDRVDLGNQGRVDQARSIEQFLVGPSRVLALEVFADGVVLEGEYGVHQLEPDPPVPRDAGDLDSGLGIDRQQTVPIHLQLAIDARTNLLLDLLIAAVELRRVPPGAGLVYERRRIGLRPASRVMAGAQYGHGLVRPGVALFQVDLPRVGLAVLAVSKPIVDVELQPGGCQK